MFNSSVLDGRRPRVRRESRRQRTTESIATVLKWREHYFAGIKSF